VITGASIQGHTRADKRTTRWVRWGSSSNFGTWAFSLHTDRESVQVFRHLEKGRVLLYTGKEGGIVVLARVY